MHIEDFVKGTEKSPGIPWAIVGDVPLVGGTVSKFMPVRFTVLAAGAVAADDDYFVAASTPMQVGAYTLLHTSMPGIAARNVTVTHADTSTRDTLGTVTVAGTNLAGEAITESITPSGGAVASGVRAFRTITSITGVGWVVNSGADLVKFGFGDVVGLPSILPFNTVFAAYLAGTKESTAPTVVVDADYLEKNTIDLNSTLNGGQVDVLYFAPWSDLV